MNNNFKELELEILKLYKNKKYKELIILVNILKEKHKNNVFLLDMLGKSYYELNEYKLSCIYFKKILIIDPKNKIANNNLANVLQMQNFFDEALIYYKNVLNEDKNSYITYKNMARIYKKLKQYPKVIQCYEKVISLNNNIPYVYTEIINSKLMCCDWNDLDKYINAIVSNNKIIKIFDPYISLAVFDNLSILRAITKVSLNYKYGNELKNSKKNIRTLSKNKNKNKNKNKKIKIAYISADFKTHPVSQLLVEILELHDKSKFEIIAISLNPDDEDSLSYRIKKAVSSYIDLKEKTILESVDIIKNINIDIAIDLNGYTKNNKNKIFFYDIAPILINYLGYPSTLGNDLYDYIIADRIIVPECSKEFYSENVLYLPNCFQSNDTKRSKPKGKFKRSDFNLPEDKFIFCSFNNTYKLNHFMFQAWMKILELSQNSILWLKLDNDYAIKNIKKEIKKYNIDENRVIFANRTNSYVDHIARYELADLFLDSFPFNAHTTASEALWMGLPILTLQGQSYISRVSSSLLTSIGLDSLITKDINQYIQVAVKLYNEKETTIKDMRSHIQEKSDNHQDLFNSKQYTKDLENLYIEVSNKRIRR